MDIFDPQRMLLKLARNRPHFAIYYQLTPDAAPYLLPNYDAVLPRFGTTSTSVGCRVLSHFEAMGVPCLNGSAAFSAARDKWLSLQRLAQRGIAVPDSLIGGNETAAPTAVDRLPLPQVLKTLSGSQGIGVMLAEKKPHATAMLETLRQAGVPTLQQAFIAEAGNADIRCFVIGGRAVAAMQRCGQSGEFRANCHRGGTTSVLTLTAAENALAVQAAAALELDVAGVDLIRSTQGLLVLEVNASPGLEMIEKTTGVDIAAQLIAHTENLIVRR